MKIQNTDCVEPVAAMTTDAMSGPMNQPRAEDAAERRQRPRAVTHAARTWS